MSICGVKGNRVKVLVCQSKCCSSKILLCCTNVEIDILRFRTLVVGSTNQKVHYTSSKHLQNYLGVLFLKRNAHNRT